MAKYIFVTGGVVSSLGKGLTSAAIGLLLERRGLKVGIQKLDPYINVDPGTMSPFQHGEVYVTDDGAETDLDLGHYERFTHTPINRTSNFTAGRIYQTVIQKERKGEYLGKTVQVVPHVTDEIKSAILAMAKQDLDVVITEVGGTVGDIEGLPFFEAIRQFALEQGRDRVMFIHLTLVPFLRAAGELKTKPSQHSVAHLRQIGIQPDILVCRTEQPIDEELQRKLSLFCNVPREAVIEELDVDGTIYEVPLQLHAHEIDDLIVRRLQLPARSIQLDDWRELVAAINGAKESITIGVVGKYVALNDSYKSIYEALAHAGHAHNVRVEVKKIQAEDVESLGAPEALRGLDGVLVPGGFGDRGLEGKIAAIRYAREQGLPFFGICLGMQMAVIEFARHVVGMAEATTAELDPDSQAAVVGILPEQAEVTDKGGTMRLGAYACDLKPGSLAARLYGSQQVHERHRHRLEVMNEHRPALEAAGLVISGVNPERGLVEIVEYPQHPFFVGVQFHPEFGSRPLESHPLFRGFVGAATAHSRGSQS